MRDAREKEGKLCLGGKGWRETGAYQSEIFNRREGREACLTASGSYDECLFQLLLNVSVNAHEGGV